MIVPSKDPLDNILLLLLNATDNTLSVCPFNVVISLNV